jgi:hypothetical protein
LSETEESTKSDDNVDWLSWQEKNEPQDSKNHPTQLTTTKKFELLRHAEIQGNTRHKRQDPALPPIFIPGITDMLRLTVTIEQVVNRLNYTLKVINSDTIKMMTNKLDYYKIIIDILKEKKV